MMGFLLETTIRRYGLSLEGKVKIVEKLRGPLRSMHNHVGRAVYVRELAARLDVDESAILEQIRTAPERRRARPGVSQPRRSSPCKLEEALVGMMLQAPDIVGDFDASKMIEDMQNDELKQVGKMILDAVSEDSSCTGADLIARTEDPGLRNLISSLAAAQGPWDRGDCLKIVRQYQTYVQRNRAKSLSKRIREAEQANDQGLLEKLLTEKQRFVQEKREGLPH
jgi:DNA primase